MQGKDFLQHFINANNSAINRLCKAYSRSADEYNDLRQEVYYQLWRTKDQFRGESATSTWVYRVTLNVCIGFSKKRSYLIQLDAIDPVFEESDLSKEEDIARLYEALKKLSKQDRAIILLYLEEKSYEEISAIIGITTSNVGVKINRIKKKLRSLLETKS